MYRKAVSDKTAGSITAITLLLVLTGVSVWLARYERSALLLAVVLAGYMVGAAVSMFGYRMRLAKMREQYPGDLEADTDRCTEYAAGRYFFLSDRLVDMENARIYDYLDIADASGVLLTEPRQRGRRSAVIALEMQNGRRYRLTFLKHSFRRFPGTVEENYDRFCDLLEKYWYSCRQS